ncbi:MAG: diaminopimelate decarboxylase [Candidatus Magasanikbacteria bacterium RIFCSPHIGHO2_02_FULL_41_13]|uniref:Diaminopimelate decarboxylase n=1 Tax=Candidatus Magasanikbacteria bacterium RIFCSPHIGHO2_02_FULL_41_13 TaxID=1798676 RepID=A0A1F6M4U2_9BACT|nr:MAG: diaminopimelate decarboxylase [Candidatus Magasanikbacteria bacterium RIFCSPHIGHO2_02_FULL_41_13]
MNLIKLVEQFGTPLYAYDLGVIQARIDELFATVGTYKNTQFLYAIKANFNPHIVRNIIARGCGIDAVSIDEVKLGLFCGAAAQDILFTENNITDEEMHTSMQLGVLLNIGSLSRLEKFGIAYPGSRVCVRFNPNVGAGSHTTNITGGPESKFGISFSEVDAVLIIAKKYNLKIVGIHEHIGSGWLQITEPLLALNTTLRLAHTFPDLEFVDVGGGFGVPYSPEQTRLDLKVLGEKIKARFTNFCTAYGRDIQLRFEPGRYIVAESGHLLTRVNTIKQSPEGKLFVGSDTGMNHLVRVAMYDSYHPIVNVSNPNGQTKVYDIVGNICECADFFARNREMPEIREEDILDIQIAGAYGMSMASHYQFRDLPTEVLVDGENIQVIRRRESFEERIKIFDIE